MTRASSPAHRTLVFDEIDTGIGGRAAEAVGKKLKAFSRPTRCCASLTCRKSLPSPTITTVIEKKDSADRTRTTVRLITGDERTEEVARMLSGAKLTETSRKHAEQMLKTNA